MNESSILSARTSIPTPPGLKDDYNNKMERMPILSGMQIFHNYIRPHEALKGRTPSEAAGIRVEGENKWITLIQNARQMNKEKIG
ncbi:MAG: hypothetical protein ABSA92_03390 [Candidatus Bathyarchaeia archaeon]|jgi:hypothetical protein